MIWIRLFWITTPAYVVFWISMLLFVNALLLLDHINHGFPMSWENSKLKSVAVRGNGESLVWKSISKSISMLPQYLIGQSSNIRPLTIVITCMIRIRSSFSILLTVYSRLNLLNHFPATSHLLRFLTLFYSKAHHYVILLSFLLCLLSASAKPSWDSNESE